MDNSIMDLLLGNDSINNVTLESDADRAMVIMAALKEESTPEEFGAMMESARQLEIFDVVPNATTAMEAVEKRIAHYTKTSKLNQATKAACLRLAKQAGDPNYDKYRKYRLLMFEAREKIYTKYESKATRVAKDILRGARNGAASMKNATGKGISDKLDKTIKKIEKEGSNRK